MQRSMETRLFMSVDMQGSTAFKTSIAPPAASNEGTVPSSAQDSDEPIAPPPWIAVFETFYRDFVDYCGQQVKGLPPLSAETRPTLVKTIGDELLLSSPVLSAKDAQHLLASLRNAIKLFTSLKLRGLPLRLKGTAWLANFPTANAIVDLGDGRKDFIGPAMDAGFRLTAFATPAKIPVSVDLAMLLLARDHFPVIPLFFDGSQPLRSVLNGTPYPIIWYPNNQDHLLIVAERGLRGPEPTSQALYDYCHSFIRSPSVKQSWLTLPRLPGVERPIKETP
jgi:hypothetical protein